MKKTLLSLAVVAGLTASGASFAGATVYGMIDVSANSVSDSTNTGATGATGTDLMISSNTSALGVKGSEDLGNGMKALYKIEFQVDVMNQNGGKNSAENGTSALVDRDQFVGIKGGMGTVLIGTMSSNYKQKGGSIDPFYRTAVQARSVGMQSGLHKAAGTDGGRLTNAVQWTSPAMGGIQAVVNAGFAGNGAETTGLGIRYKAKNISAWFDMLNAGDFGQANDGESGIKVGGSYKMDELTLAAQMEMIEDLTGNDVMFLSAKYALDKNNTLAFSYGATTDVTAGFTLGAWHKLSKKTSAYAAFNSMSEDGGTIDGSITTVGLRTKF